MPCLYLVGDCHTDAENAFYMSCFNPSYVLRACGVSTFTKSTCVFSNIAIHRFPSCVGTHVIMVNTHFASNKLPPVCCKRILQDWRTPVAVYSNCLISMLTGRLQRIEFLSMYPMRYWRKIILSVKSLNYKPEENWVNACKRGSMQQCHKTPLPALPWHVPPMRKDGKFVMVDEDIPWTLRILCTMCVIVREWYEATDRGHPTLRIIIVHSSWRMRS